MSFPIYEAVGVIDVLKGGTTRPVIMQVTNGKEILTEKYVVKIFSQTDIAQYKPTNKEFYAAALLGEFDLSSPKTALIYVSKEIIDILEKQGISEGYYFGCEYLNDVANYEWQPLDEYETERLETIFAFDALIRNMDRRVGKSNILIKEEKFWLIDHELSLDIQNNDGAFYLENIKLNFLNRVDRRHIFFDFLQTQKVTFNLFQEYSKYLNFSAVLMPIAKQLADYQQDTNDVYNIITYLEYTKSNLTTFISLLKKLLS